jgi:EAL domain-containing protein (putative c-di-GMP-specific phosphodiesterase class I)
MSATITAFRVFRAKREQLLYLLLTLISYFDHLLIRTLELCMSSIRPWLRLLWVRVIFILVGSSLCAIGSFILFQAATYEQNVEKMRTLAASTVARAEHSIDYAVITLGDLAVRGLTQCDAMTLLEIRKTMVERGSIKDVQVRGAMNQLKCAGLPQSQLIGLTEFEEDSGFPARNSNIVIHKLSKDGSGLLSVNWAFSPTLTLLAVLNIDELMFGVFPNELRESGEADLLLGDTLLIGQYKSEETVISKAELITVSNGSSRYPVSVAIRVDRLALMEWNREGSAIVAALGGLIGALLLVLLIGRLSAPENPVDLIRQGMRRGEFVPYYQPIFDIADQSIIGCEALVRWQKADGSIVGPNAFIPQAESSGLIIEMTRQLIRQGLAELGPILTHQSAFMISFNVTPADLLSERFAADVCQLADTANVRREQIIFEITEREELGVVSDAILAIAALRLLGFHIALDDTGTGHNGLANVQQLGANIIKIDKHFVDQIEENDTAVAIVDMLVRVSRQLGALTVAEGIETSSQLDALRRCGVDKGQGYLVAPALPRDKFAALYFQKAKLIQQPIGKAAA